MQAFIEQVRGAYHRHAAPILALCLMKLFLQYNAFVAGFRILANDESCRWHMAYGWMQDPFFAPWDHVWPGGYFYLAGTWMAIFGTSFAAAKMLPICLTMLSAAGFYLAGAELFRSRFCGFIAAMLCLGGYVNTWISVSFMPEIMAISFTAWGTFLAFRGIMQDNRGALMAGSLVLGLTASFRYEQWFLLAAWQVVLLLVLILDRSRWRAVVVSGVLSSSYILAWMASSWLRYGSPLAFFRNSQAVTITAEGNPAVAMFGHLMWWEGLIFTVGFAAHAAMLLFGKREQRLYALWILGFGLLFVASLKVGTAAATWRIVQGWRCTLVLMIPILFSWLLAPRFGAGINWTVRVVVLAAALTYVGTQMEFARRPPGWEFRKDTWALGDWLLFERNEFDAGRPEFFKDRGFDRILLQGVGDPGRDMEDFWAVAYFLGNPNLMRVADGAVQGDPNVIITRRDDTPAGWSEARRMGVWRLLVPAPAP